MYVYSENIRVPNENNVALEMFEFENWREFTLLVPNQNDQVYVIQAGVRTIQLAAYRMYNAFTTNGFELFTHFLRNRTKEVR